MRIRKKTIELNDYDYVSTSIEKCDKCHKKKRVYYTDSEKKLCENCLFEEVSKDEAGEGSTYLWNK